MKLKSLHIDLNATYEKNPGKYCAVAKFEDDDKNEVKMVLPPALSENLLAYLAPAMSAITARQSRELEASIAESIREARQLPEIAMEATL